MPTSYLPSSLRVFPSLPTHYLSFSPLSSMASPSSSPLLSFPNLPISLTSLSTPSMASIVNLSSSSTLQASSSRIFSSQTTPRLSFHSHFTPSTTFHSISRKPPKLKKKKKKFSSFAIVSALNKLSQSNSVTVPSGPDEFTVKIPSDSGVYAIYGSNNDFQFIGLSRSIAASVLSDKKSVPELCSSVKAGSGSFHEQNIQTALEMLHVRDHFGDICENPVKYISDIEGYTVSSFKHENFSAQGISLSSWLKFLMLIGFSTLQDSHQALASSGFSNGLPFLPDLAGLGDISTGFASVKAFLLIFFSELGDKTFFIAALLAARNSGVVVFIGTFGALAAMSIISVVIGRTFHYVDDILPFRFGETDLPIDDIAAVCLLIYFGVSTLIEAASSDSPKAEEEQKEAEIAVSDFSGNGAGIVAAASTVISTFVLVFVAEWGDKSFFSTIALSAASSPVGVIGGAVAGHGAATLLAVLGGSLLGTFLSEKVIAYVGGTLFLVFAVVTLIEIVT